MENPQPVVTNANCRGASIRTSHMIYPFLFKTAQNLPDAVANNKGGSGRFYAVFFSGFQIEGR